METRSQAVSLREEQVPEKASGVRPDRICAAGRGIHELRSITYVEQVL